MVVPTFILKQIASALGIIALTNLVIVPPTLAAADEGVIGLCQEVEVGSNDYKFYTSRAKGFHTVPVFKNANGGPAWKVTPVKSINGMNLTINTPDPAHYAVIMDTTDHSDANLAHNIVIKMANKGKDHFFQMEDFVTCKIPRQEPKETPEWAYLVEPFTYTGGR